MPGPEVVEAHPHADCAQLEQRVAHRGGVLHRDAFGKLEDQAARLEPDSRSTSVISSTSEAR